MTPVAQILSWVAPPVLGGALGAGLIGMAFRMLFRPVNEVRVLGVRVPGTPGVLPRRRAGLARAIGRLVADQLVNEESLRSALHAEGTAKTVGEGVATATEALLSTPLSAVADGVSAVEVSAAGPGVLPRVLRSLLQRLLGSPTFLHGVREAVAKAAGTQSAKRLQEALGRLDLESVVRDRLLPRLADPSTRDAIAGSLAGAIGDGPGSLLSDDLLASISEIAQPYLPFAADRLVAWMRSDETRAYLSSQARDLLPRILEKLNMVQRLLLSAGQFDRRLDEKMPEIVDETLRNLETIARDEHQQAALLATLVQAARDWRDRSSSAGGSSVRRVIEQILKSFEEEGARARIARLLRERLEAGNPTVGGVVRDLTGWRDSDVADLVTDRLLQYLSRLAASDGGGAGFGDLGARLLKENAALPLGEALGLDADAKARIDAVLKEKLLGTLDRQLPSLVRRLDVESLVARRLEDLDMTGLERLAIRSVGAPLRWIGVGLGAAIGIVVDIAQHLAFFGG